MENINEWVEWMTRNPELAEKYYPKIMQGLTEQIKKSEPFFTALMIQKLPDHFPNWKSEAEKHFGIKRIKIIQRYINLINAVLIEYEYPNEIEQNAVESVRNELVEQLQYWNKQIDISFWLTTFIEGQEQSKQEFKYFKREIEQHGFISIKVESEVRNFKIFTASLAVILTSKNLQVKNMDTQTETTINGWNYLNTYIEAYIEGEQYFETEFKVSPNTIYGANAEQYVRDIHQNFFHVQHTGINEGWGYVKKQYPIILTHQVIKEFGYYSGIVNKVEEQVKKHPQLFATFDKCEHNLPPQQTEMKTAQETENDFTLSTIEDWLFEFKEKMSETDYQNLVSALMKYFETGIFPILSKPIQINGRPNKKLFGWALNRIFEAKGKRVEKELLQFAKQNISLFTDVQFDEKNILKSNLYKYFTTKTD